MTRWIHAGLALSLIVSICLLPTVAASQAMTSRPAYGEKATPVIRVEASATTWRARQRVSFPLKAAIRVRLLAAGLQVNMSDPSTDHADDALLTVAYREERGQQVSLDIYGTEVTSDFILEHPQRGQVLALTIKESPSYGGLSTLPYIDVIQQFETNPYFYFLGYVVRGALEGQQPGAALLTALARSADSDISRPNGSQAYPEASESLPSFEPQYEQRAIARAIQELARLKQSDAGPVFMKLLTHPDWHVRLQAVRALDQIGAGESTAVLVELARHDPDVEVRQAAEQTLAHLEASPTAP